MTWWILFGWIRNFQFEWTALSVVFSTSFCWSGFQPEFWVPGTNCGWNHVDSLAPTTQSHKGPNWTTGHWRSGWGSLIFRDAMPGAYSAIGKCWKSVPRSLPSVQFVTHVSEDSASPDAKVFCWTILANWTVLLWKYLYLTHFLCYPTGTSEDDRSHHQPMSFFFSSTGTRLGGPDWEHVPVFLAGKPGLMMFCFGAFRNILGWNIAWNKPMAKIRRAIYSNSTEFLWYHC